MDKVKRETSYIGVTGFTKPEEVEAALRAVNGKLGGRLLMIGVLASQQTMLGNDGKFPARYPKVAGIANLFPDDAECLNLIHYATGDRSTLLEQLIAVTKIAGPSFNGFQLNVAWPDADVLRKYKELYPDKVFVFAVSKKVFESVEYSPDLLAERLRSTYGNLIDYVLLDPSGGMGQPFNAEDVKRYMVALSLVFKPWQIGAAGGLGPDTLGLVEPLVAEFPDMNIDAEGKVRIKPEDTMSIPATVGYLDSALALFGVKA